MKGHMGTHHGQSLDTCLLNSNGEVLVPRPARREKGPRVPSVYRAEARQADRRSVPTRGRNSGEVTQGIEARKVIPGVHPAGQRDEWAAGSKEVGMVSSGTQNKASPSPGSLKVGWPKL